MNEVEWLAGEDPRPMLNMLAQGNVSRRKLRLFAVACCRRAWDRLVDERSRRAVLVAERFADGKAEPGELKAAEQAADQALSENWHIDWGCRAAVRLAKGQVGGVAHEIAKAICFPEQGGEPLRLARAELAALLRDIVGNPSRPRAFNPHWRTATAVALAASIYESREFGQLPILADALQDAGCDDEQVLSHCREPGLHTRGCWVVDLLLGME